MVLLPEEARSIMHIYLFCSLNQPVMSVSFFHNLSTIALTSQPYTQNAKPYTYT